MTTAARSASVPGPVDREDFWDAQRRNRRASWRFTALAALGIGVMGIPMSAVISPLVYAGILIGIDLVNLVVPTPNLFMRHATSASTTSTTSTGPVPPALIVVAVVLFILPGALWLIFSWISVRTLFKRAGASAIVLALGAREPRTGELEEHQVENVVAEMAAACGVPAPPVRILDTPVANACAVGSSFEDATVIVTTGLLDALDRDETQAVMGDVMGSVGNGDLRIATTIITLFQTLGFAGTFLRAPAEKSARRTVWRLLKFALSAGHRNRTDEAAAVADMLADSGGDWETDADDSQKSGCLSSVKSIFTLPFLAAGGAFMMTNLVFMMMIVNPLMRRAWRARRYLADASAVELTRNPEALGRALTRLRSRGGIPPGAEWAAHLFVVNEGHAQIELSPEDRQELMKMQRAMMHAHGEERERLAADMRARMMAEAKERGIPIEQPKPKHDAAVMNYQPKFEKRLERLNRMGAMAEVSPVRAIRMGGGPKLIFVLVMFVIGPLLAAAVILMFAAALLFCMISLMIDSMFLAPVVAVIHALLRNAAK